MKKLKMSEVPSLTFMSIVFFVFFVFKWQSGFLFPCCGDTLHVVQLSSTQFHFVDNRTESLIWGIKSIEYFLEYEMPILL